MLHSARVKEVKEVILPHKSLFFTTIETVMGDLKYEAGKRLPVGETFIAVFKTGASRDPIKVLPLKKYEQEQTLTNLNLTKGDLNSLSLYELDIKLRSI